MSISVLWIFNDLDGSGLLKQNSVWICVLRVMRKPTHVLLASFFFFFFFAVLLHCMFLLTFLPACQHMHLYTSAHPVRTDRIRHQHVHVCCADSARMAGKHQQPDLPSWYWTHRSCIQEAWLWTAICREGGTFAFSAISLKLAFSKIFYCTFKCLSKYDTRVIKYLKN